jgi:hypothetical protein
VSVGVTTLNTTAPSSVLASTRSFCFQASEPGAMVGHRLTVCAQALRAMRSAQKIMPAILNIILTAKKQSGPALISMSPAAPSQWETLLPAPPHLALVKIADGLGRITRPSSAIHGAG